jgi:hypothetical protein
MFWSVKKKRLAFPVTGNELMDQIRKLKVLNRNRDPVSQQESENEIVFGEGME